MSTKNLKEKFECELCAEGFNQYDKKPCSIVPCGHTMCLHCLNRLEASKPSKSVCPFCRENIEAKVPNWEVIKRLPKATIPLVYNQLKIKLNALSTRVDTLYFKTGDELFATIELIAKLAERLNNQVIIEIFI